VVILAEATTSPRDAPGWVHRGATTGADAIGMDETGAVVTGTAATGTIGMEIGIIIMAIASSLLATSAFHGGGVGDIQDITAMGIRTDTMGTAMDILTDTVAMVMAGMDTVTTAMGMATVLAGNTVPAANTGLQPGRE
jgi:hypothetical protein